MGYRPDVVIALHIEIIAEDLIKPIIPKALKKLGYTLYGNAAYYFIDSWKWYSDFPDIAEIEAFFRILDERMPTLVGKETLPWFGALRMGENDDDIETWGSPHDFDIYINRSITCPVCG